MLKCCIKCILIVLDFLYKMLLMLRIVKSEFLYCQNVIEYCDTGNINVILLICPDGRVWMVNPH